MNDPIHNPTRVAELVGGIRRSLSGIFGGQEALVDGALAAVLAGCRVLVERVPGLGKTLL